MKFCGILLCGLFVLSTSVADAAPLQAMSRELQFRSTDRLPNARGEAIVERRGDTTEVEVNLDRMKPASLFGGDYNTYVLWVVSPEGRTKNLGEFMLHGRRSRLHISVDSSAMAGLLVTAEPHFLVTAPSPFVVLKSGNGQYAETEHEYYFERTTLSDTKAAKGEVRTEMKQAFTAFRLAQRAGAAVLASPEFREAEHALDWTFELSRKGTNPIEIAAQAREAVRLAVVAQQLAERAEISEN